MRERKKKPVVVRYCAKDFLDGVSALGPLEELVYRRLCDLIYSSGDNLLDEDEAKMGRITKSFSRWLEIKKFLVEKDKIRIVGGRITNNRCQTELAATAVLSGQRSAAGKASRSSIKPAETTNPIIQPVAAIIPLPPTGTGHLFAPPPPPPPADPPPIDPLKQLFDIGVTLLCRSGAKESAARSVIGKWRKLLGQDDELLVTLFMRCRNAAIVNPIEWIGRAISERAARGRDQGEGAAYL